MDSNDEHPLNIEEKEVADEKLKFGTVLRFLQLVNIEVGFVTLEVSNKGTDVNA